MQFGSMPERETIDAVFILRRLQEKYDAKGKRIYMCFVDLEKAFDRVARKVLEWTMRKKGIPEVLVLSVISLHEGAKTKVRVDSMLSEEFEVKAVMHQGSVLSSFLIAVVVSVVTEYAREDVLSALLYADDLALMSETIVGIRDKFLKWKEAFESKCLKVNLGKTMAMVSSGITQDGLSKSNVGPCVICSLRVKVISVLCVQCGRWTHGRCAGVKRLKTMFSRDNVKVLVMQWYRKKVM